MPATSQDLTGDDVIEAGKTYRRVFQYVAENGDALDFTDYDSVSGPATAVGGRAYLRLTVDTAGSSLLALTPVTNIDHEGVYILQPPTLGQVQLLIFSATTEALSYDTGGDAPIVANRSGVWDLELAGIPAAPPLGQEVLGLAIGAYAVTPESTRPTI